jgi:protein gp37
LATAPTPGVGRRAETATAAKRVLVIKLAWSDQAYRIAVNNVPLDHRMAVRKATGISLTAFIGGEDAIDLDSIAVLVWVARRVGGEPGLSWQQFQRTWPDEVSEGDIEVWAEDVAGNKLDEDGNVIDDTEPAEVDDPES